MCLYPTMLCVCLDLQTFFVVFIVIVLCSIYKAMLKSKGTINEVDQIAQVHFDIFTEMVKS